MGLALSRYAANVRDLGGLCAADGCVVRSGKLYRSAALVDLPASQVRAVTEEMGPNHLFDLRSDWEVKRDGGLEDFQERGWVWHRLPIEEDLAERRPRVRHLRSMSEYVRAARHVILTLSGDGHESSKGIVSCSLGKDRTGIVVALLLKWLGVSESEIVGDYEASNDKVRAERALLPQRWRHPWHRIGVVDGIECLAAIADVDLEALPIDLKKDWLEQRLPKPPTSR